MQNGTFSHSHVFQIVKAVLLTTVFSFVGVFVFSLVLRFFPVGVKAIRPVDIVLRAVCIFLGCAFSLRGEKGLIKGVAVGALSSLTTRFLFCSLVGEFTIGLLFVAEVAFSCVVGALAGIFCANKR